jgi:phosphoglucan,water dikinase
VTERRSIRIGNQSAFSANPMTAPFEYAVKNGFDAFEWFPDKKTSGAGWSETDIDDDARKHIRETALACNIRLSVHSPLPSSPPKKGAVEDAAAIRFARDIGAKLYNVHYAADSEVDGNAKAVISLLKILGTKIQLSIENTPAAGPEDFNRLFELLRKSGFADAASVGMCLDLGHANLHGSTRNDYLRYIDLLDPDIPIIHVHLHENFGESDNHLPVFTGPSAQNDAGIRGFVDRLQRRSFSGSIILEQWPDPPDLLKEARDRLNEIIRQSRGDAGPPSGPSDGTDDFAAMIVKADRQYRSWRNKLEWISDLLGDSTSEITDEKLAYLAIYLRFIGTGQIRMAEDGGHYRPSHHARIASHIHERLSKIENPDNAFIIRKIYPWLPSFNTPFMRAEPLTRIRDIAHRNDIPRELKEEIKTTLQNKLHRSAGPEDLLTSSALLEKITSPGATYPETFVEEFRRFHEELKEFFNARSLDEQLSAIAKKHDAEMIEKFIQAKGNASSPAQMLSLFGLLTALRSGFNGTIRHNVRAEAQELQVADIMLEDYSFPLMSRLINSFTKDITLREINRPSFPQAERVGNPSAGAKDCSPLPTSRNDKLAGTNESMDKKIDWQTALRCLLLITTNLRLSGFDEEECSAIESEVNAWSSDFDAGDRLKLLRLKATFDRLSRLADGYADRILDLFPGKAEILGHALGVSEHAIRFFSESDIRAHVVFQLSKLLSLLLKEIRIAAAFPAWDIIVPGKAAGCLTEGKSLDGLPAFDNTPVIVMLKKVEGDEEIPAGVRAIITEEETPHLSHLAVRARQRRVAFAVCEDIHVLEELRGLIDKQVLLDLAEDKVAFREYEGEVEQGKTPAAPILSEIILSPAVRLVPLEEATPETCGNKAFAARRLEELSRLGAPFLTSPAYVIPFGVMEEALGSARDLEREYAFLMSGLKELQGEAFDASVGRLHAIPGQLEVPAEVISGMEKCKHRSPLMVRSSSNCEDLEGLSGAGLYESVANVPAAETEDAIRKVLASLWTRRATLSRALSGVPHEKAHMAVLIQEMISPDYCFIIHTENPANGKRDEIYIEIAAGLGEALASGRVAGLPCRIIYDRMSGDVKILSFANFSRAVMPGKTGGTIDHIIDYSHMRLSTEDTFRKRLASRLGEIGKFIEESFGKPQDIEGVVAGNDIYIVQSRPQQIEETGLSSCRVLGLFQKRIDGDDALLELARLQFREAGLGAELYAETPEEMEWLLRFRPSDELPAVVHLPRGTDLFRRQDRDLALAFLKKAGGRIYGMVLHDQKEMADRQADYITFLRALHGGVKRSGCRLFIEYAAGLEPEVFSRLFENIADLDRISCCIDTGHVGLHYARIAYARLRPGRDMFSAAPGDPDLPLLIGDIQAAVESALEGVLSLTRIIGALGKPVHFHLHDGHPLFRSASFGTSDHLSFLETIRLPFEAGKDRFLPPMFGPSGLARIVAEAVKSCREKVSFTIEVHPSDGRLSLGNAAHLFTHWKDKGNAERMNHWLSVLTANGRFVLQECGKSSDRQAAQ